MITSIHRITGIRLYFLEVHTRVPLKFGPETLTSVTCARVSVQVADRNGHVVEGWGETPLSVQWVWPGTLPYSERHEALRQFCGAVARKWMTVEAGQHPLEVGWRFQQEVLLPLLQEVNSTRSSERKMPWLAALVCSSPFDLALHDAFGKLAGLGIYECYTREFLAPDLAQFLQPVEGTRVSFENLYPADFLIEEPTTKLPAWHLVGGLDPLSEEELTGNEPDDGYPVMLTDWITRDGLDCLKIKLRGNDADWDYARLVRVGAIACECSVQCLSADFNCTVLEPAYVNGILDRLRAEHRQVYDLLLYVEQPFPYELEEHPIDVRSVACRKPLFLDESAHDWRMVRLGRDLGWTGVALKTCKTQTGAILSACWAKAHGMSLMVQDLTNPMLAQIPHVLLAANVGTIMGVESNAMQFYPEASIPEARVHPGLYRRRGGQLDLESIRGPGFGYRVDEIDRELPQPVLSLASA